MCCPLFFYGSGGQVLGAEGMSALRSSLKFGGDRKLAKCYA